MSGQRIETGGALIDRSQSIAFKFEGRLYHGHAGDTVASALLANGVSVCGRSFKYHRPRGIFAAGVEEPNALMQLGEGAYTEANPPATQVELYEGLVARAVNCWPNVDFDLGAINNVLARFVPAGFYYKTFLWPNWRVYEPFIRRAAGLGRPSSQPDPDHYDARFAHCDVLVVGSGPAGLAGALAAARSGARTILVEQDIALGGSLRWRGGEVDATPSDVWLSSAEVELRAMPNCRVLTRTAALGYFDHNALALLESVTGHLPPGADQDGPRRRLWQVRAKQVILACGAIERPIVFPGNDRPGVMLASAVARYLGDFGVLAGQTAVYFTNNDSAYASAEAFVAAGGRIAAFVDTRTEVGVLASRLKALGGRLVLGGVVVSTEGCRALSKVRIRDTSGQEFDVRANLLAVSGGWSPTIHLHCQSGGAPHWDDKYSCLIPGDPVQEEVSVGACAGAFSLSEALEQGALAGMEAVRGAGRDALAASPAPRALSTMSFRIDPRWRVEGPGKAFVDLQTDVTADDITLAARENFCSVEHLKRYTTLGMGIDQGKTSNVNALAMMAELCGVPPAQAGVTRYRFPYTPAPLSAFAGVNRGEIFRPQRRLTLHQWHAAHGAMFEEYGSWLRPAYYLRAGETPHQAELREARGTRAGAVLFDGSPLGKIEVKGPDAGKLLDRLYANRMSDLKPGHCRYGLMLNELGVIIDDGICTRLGDDVFLVGTTSGGSKRIAAWIEEWLQCEWTQLNVLVAPVDRTWDVITVAGPNARTLLERVGVDFDVSKEAFPHLSLREGHVGGADARVCRASYTGEVSYEINVSPDRIAGLWSQFVEAGASLGVMPVGINAWMLLRAERGFLHVGADTDGTTTPLDVGWGRVLKRKDDFIGRRSLMRPADQRPDRLNFVGFDPVDANAALRVGLPIRAAKGKPTDGYITSAGLSPHLNRYVALGMIESGRARIGEIVSVVTDGGDVVARIVDPGVFDPEGARVHG